MTSQSLNPELTAKVLLLANLQRTIIQNKNQNAVIEKTADEKNIVTASIGHHHQQQQLTHPLLIPSLNVSSQKISAMLAALTPIPVANSPMSTTYPSAVSSLTISNNNAVNTQTTNLPANMRSNGSSFGWGNRERKMEENWRLQNRNM